MNKYTVKYFIKKFEAIPENKWTTGVTHNKLGKHCVLGHCGARWEVGEINTETKESQALDELFRNNFNRLAYRVNDGSDDFDKLGDSPKERILNALYLIDCDATWDLK